MNIKLMCGAALALIAASQSNAGFIDLAGGWRASWDSSLNDQVDIADNGVTTVGGNDVQIIEKTAEFLQPPPLPGLPFPTIQITFQQTSPDAVPYIAIDDEIITNSTGVRWTDFHMILLDHDDAFFDPDLTMASGGGSEIGFSIEPFQMAEFTPDNRRLDIYDGVVENDEIWRPGDGATDGLLWIATNTHTGGPDDPFTVFSLKETPTPAPGGVALMALAGVLGASRRRQG